MNSISLLDCTLRDGGYVNDWKFGKTNLSSIFERLTAAKVDFIEVGFLDDRRPFDKDRSIFPDTKSADRLFSHLDKKGAQVVGMIDFGTCDIANLAPKEESYLDGIRVIFKKAKMKAAMEYCRQVKALGYKVFSQLVSVTSYTDEELLELIELVNDVKPYGVSMVDTYGLLDREKLLHIYKILDDNVAEDVVIGFHAHNNFQLAYSNSQAFLEYPGKHNILVDATLYGMGKSAGNTPIELISMTLNDKYGKSYNIDSMLEAINESVMDFYRLSPWGYKQFFYLVAKNKCHPNYLTDYEKKEQFSVSMLDELLSTIEPEDKKLLYDKEVSEKYYELYMKEHCDEGDSVNAFLDFVGDRKLLLIGPGKNVLLQEDSIDAFIKTKDCVTISINYLPEKLNVDSVFITNPKRYHDMTLPLKNSHVKTLATTNVSCRDGRFDFVINRAPLLETNEKIIDNSFLMLIKFLNRIGIREVYCAGFDGYSENDNNYAYPGMEYSFVRREAQNLNSYMKKAISDYRNSMDIKFITYSAYDYEEDIHGGAI